MSRSGKRAITGLALLVVATITFIVLIASYSSKGGGFKYPIQIEYERSNGMLLVTISSTPKEVLMVFRSNGQVQGMAYTLTDNETYLPPVYGDGEYQMYIKGRDYILTDACQVTDSDEKKAFLSPTLSMVKYMGTLPADVGEHRSFTEITELFAEVFSCNAQPNEGLMSPYTPDPGHTRELRSGACADLTSLYVLYLRSAGIPAKVAYGDRTDYKGKKEAHSWAVVYTEGKWRTVDITALCAKKDCSEPFADEKRYSGIYCVY